MDTNYWSRRRLNRRGVLGSAAGIGVGTAALALVGCGGDDDEAAPTAGASGTTSTANPSANGSPEGGTGEPKKGGELTFGVSGTSNQPLDPHIGLSTYLAYWPYISNLLIKHDVKNIEPLEGELVESWEQVDESTLILKARAGVKFHEGRTTNGRAFTAEDIKYNLERIAGKYDEKRAAQFSRASLMVGLDRVEVTDESTARAIFSRPNATFLAGVTDWRNWTVAKESVDADPDFKDPTKFAGTGPFTWDRWDSATLTGEFSANPNYWKTGRPYIQKIKQVAINDPASAEAAFLTGKTSFFAVQSDQLRQSVTKNRSSAKIYDWEGPLWDYLRLNQTRSAFADPRVRIALFKVLNYFELLNANYGENYWNYTGPLVSGFPGAPTADELAKRSPWNPDGKDADITDAKKLMTEAGFPDGKIKFAITPTGATGAYFDHSVRIQDQLKSIWPDMDVTISPPTDSAAFQRSLTTGDFDAIVYTSGAVPSLTLECNLHYRTGSSRNYTKFSDPDIDRLIDTAAVSFVEAERNAKLKELEALLLENIWVIPLGKARAAVAVQENIHGFEGTGNGGFSGSLDPPFFADQYHIS